MLEMCNIPTHSAGMGTCCPRLVSSPGSSPQRSILWLNILFCKIRFSVPDSCGKQPSSAPLCFITVALFLTDFNHPIIKSDTALTPYHCNLINFWSHKSFLYIKDVVSMDWISYLLHRDTQQQQLCTKCSREGEQSSSWRGHRGTAFPPAKLKTPADGQQRLNCLIATEGTPKHCTCHRDLGKAGRYLGLLFIAIYFPISLHVEDSAKLTRLRFWWLAARGCDTSHSQVCAWCWPSSVCTGKGPGVTPLARHTSNRFLRNNVFE